MTGTPVLKKTPPDQVETEDSVSSAPTSEGLPCTSDRTNRVKVLLAPWNETCRVNYTNLDTHIFTLGLVQHVSFLPLAVGSFVGLPDVELHLGALFVLHGLPLVQGHLFGAFIFNLFNLVLPGKPVYNNVEP